MVLRRHREPGCVVMDSVVRSFPSHDPVCLRWDWPLWNRDDGLNPEDLEGKMEQKGPKRGAEAAVEEQNVLFSIRSLVDEERPIAKTEFIRKVQQAYDLSRTRARDLVDEAFALGYLKYGKDGTEGHDRRAAKLVLLGDKEPRCGEEDECD